MNIRCGNCGLLFEAYTARDGQRRTCPKCFNTGTVRMTDADAAELDVKEGDA